MIDEGAQDALIEYTGEDTNYENLHNCINNVTLMHCTILPETHDNLYITRAHLTLEFHVDCIIDNRSQKNLILISLVDKLKLPLEPHTYPYSLGWKDSSSSSKITHTFTVSFSLGPHFVDEVTYDVIRMDYYGLLLGNPFQYDRKAFYDAFNNTYQIQKDTNNYLIHSTQYIEQIKNLVLSCKQGHKAVNNAIELAFIFVRPQHNAPSSITTISHHKDEIQQLLNKYQYVFKSPSSLPPSRPINHAIDLIPGSSLPIAPLYQN